jgi:hypothetical protein
MMQNRLNSQTESHPTRDGWAFTIWQDLWGVWCYEVVGPNQSWQDHGHKSLKQARERVLEAIERRAR